MNDTNNNPLPETPNEPNEPKQYSEPIFTEVDPSEAKQSRLIIGRAMRPSMNEANFRRYELYIAMACYGSYKVYPKHERITRTGCGVTPHTFANNFRDAKKAYCVFSYPSTLIPSSFDPREIIATEQQDSESVEIANNGGTARRLTSEWIEEFKKTHKPHCDGEILI